MNKAFTIFLSCLLPVLCIAQDSARVKDPWKNTRAGNGMYKTKNYKGAEDKYREALKTDTASPVVNSNLGNSLYKQKKYDEAAEAWERAANSGNGDTASNAYYNKGNALFEQGDLEGSAEAYKEALKRDPDNEDARYNLAMTQKMIRTRTKNMKDTTGNFKDDPNGKYLRPDSAGNVKMFKEDPNDGKKKNGDGEKKIPLDPKKQSMTPEEAKKMLGSLKDSEQKTRQRLSRNDNSSWFKRSRDKDW